METKKLSALTLRNMAERSDSVVSKIKILDLLFRFFASFRTAIFSRQLFGHFIRSMETCMSPIDLGSSTDFSIIQLEHRLPDCTCGLDSPILDVEFPRVSWPVLKRAPSTETSAFFSSKQNV